MYHYGKCHVCGCKMESKRIKQDFWIKDKLVVIEKVPAGVCPQCGKKVVKAEVGRALALTLGGKKSLRKARTMVVPVMQYSQGAA